jgi:Histidine kinase-, DNA gyrase B-, and HSP90-like ATPase
VGPRSLTLRTMARGGGAALIEVEDTGTGISPADAERIFEPFFTTKSGGIGLGLMIARAAVQAHGGTLGMRAGTARGTIFELALPSSLDEPATAAGEDGTSGGPALPDRASAAGRSPGDRFPDAGAELGGIDRLDDQRFGAFGRGGRQQRRL